MRKIEKYINKIIDTQIDIQRLANEKVRFIMYDLGAYLNKEPGELEQLYEYLYMHYGNTIIFSKRSLMFAKMFYQKYHKTIMFIPNSITWNQCVTILRQNNSFLEDIYLFDVIQLFSLEGREIDYFLETGNVKFMLEEKYDNNNLLLEFMSL